MNLKDLIIKPLLSEKSSALKDEQGLYSFAVQLKATKLQIKEAVQSLFSVKVVDVHTLVVRGKTKRVGRNIAKKSNWKKAFIKLAKDQKIEALDQA